jgi:hypothetical protein
MGGGMSAGGRHSAPGRAGEGVSRGGGRGGRATGNEPSDGLPVGGERLATFAVRVGSVWQTTPARALRIAGRRRETAWNWARGRGSVSGRSKPFLLHLRAHVGLEARGVLGAAPKLARTGAHQGARCSDKLLSSQRRGSRKKGDYKLVPATERTSL